MRIFVVVDIVLCESTSDSIAKVFLIYESFELNKDHLH